MSSKLALVPRRSENPQKRGVCLFNQLYTYPNSDTGAIDASAGPVTFKWDTSCTVADSIDLTLYAPSLQNHSIIKIIENVQFSLGSYSLDLSPSMWDSSPEITLLLTISDADVPTFLSPVPAGPAFIVTYPQSLISSAAGAQATGTGSAAAGAATKTAGTESIVVDAAARKTKGPNAGIVAVAVIVPILVILAGVFFYVRKVRSKQAKKRERWSQHVDNRMSVISQSWQPGTSIGRPSGQHNRESRHHTRGASTSTTYDANMAGLGARTFGLDQSWQNQTYAGEQDSDQQETTEYDSRNSRLFDNTNARPSSVATHALGSETVTSRKPKANAAAHGRAISMFDKPGRVSFAVEERTSRLSMGDALRPSSSSLANASHSRSASAHSHSRTGSVFSFIGNVLTGGSPSKSSRNKTHSTRGGPGGGSISSMPSAVQRSSMFSTTKQTPPRKSYYSSYSEKEKEAGADYSDEEEEGEDEKMEELEQGMSPVPEQGPWVLGDEEDEKAAVRPDAASPDDLLASYASRANTGITPTFEYDEDSRGLGELQVAERRDIGRALAGHARPGSLAGGNNPFRQSMMSDAPSAYSGIESEHDAARNSTRHSQHPKQT